MDSRALSRRQMMLLPALLAGEAAGAISSTYLQWWAGHLEWGESRWRELFGYLRQLRVDEVVVQWTRYDEVDYTPLLERVLDLAGEGGMRVWVGLAQESTWWRDVEGGGAVGTLRRVAKKCGEQGLALSPLCRRRRAFRGWYLPFELEDVNWTAAVTAELVEEIEGLRRRLGPLALSGFTNRVLGPEALGKWWRRLGRAGLEQVFFQDGIGAGKMTLELWPAYLRALSEGLGKRLRVVVELFEMAEAGGGVVLRPAPLWRVARQCEVAREFGRGKLSSFSMVEYLTPLGGAEAGKNFEQYLNFHSTH